MAKMRAKKKDRPANRRFTTKLRLAANRLANNMDARAYRHVAPDLILRTDACDAFRAQRAGLMSEQGEYRTLLTPGHCTCGRFHATKRTDLSLTQGDLLCYSVVASSCGNEEALNAFITGIDGHVTSDSRKSSMLSVRQNTVQPKVLSVKVRASNVQHKTTEVIG